MRFKCASRSIGISDALFKPTREPSRVGMTSGILQEAYRKCKRTFAQRTTGADRSTGHALRQHDRTRRPEVGATAVGGDFRHANAPHCAHATIALPLHQALPGAWGAGEMLSRGAPSWNDCGLHSWARRASWGRRGACRPRERSLRTCITHAGCGETALHKHGLNLVLSLL